MLSRLRAEWTQGRVVVAGQYRDVLTSAPFGDTGRLYGKLRGSECRVAGAKERLVRVVSYEERRVTPAMPGEWHEEEPSIRSDIVRMRKRTNCGTGEVDDPRLQPAGPSLRKVAAQTAARPLRKLPLGLRHYHISAPERSQASHVVCMQMREDDPADCVHVEASGYNLGGSLVARRELEPSQPEKRVPAWEIARCRGRRGLARVDETQAARMFDQEDIDRQRFISPVVGEVTAQPTFASFATNATCRKNPYFHGQPLLIRTFVTGPGPCLK